jgi:hypothetical protein
MNEEANTTSNMNTNNSTGTTGTATRTEEFKVSGDEIVARIKELVHEGNVRRIIIKDADNRTLLEFPLTAGVIGVALLPVWAAIGAVIALAANCTIVVERRD